MGFMLITEETMILLATPKGMTEDWDKRRSWGLRVAAVCDLVAMGRVRVTADGDPRVECVDPTPTDVPALDRFVAALAGSGPMTMRDVLRDRRFDVGTDVAQGMSAAGAIVRERAGLLGLFPTRYRAADPTQEAALRARLEAPLAGSPADDRDVVLLSILQGLGLLATVLSDEVSRVGRRACADRVRELGDGSPLGDVLRSATRGIGSIAPALGV